MHADPQVMPGYLGAAALSDDAFDDEGFYRLGDAARLLDEGNPLEGIAFAGRISEDFKLSSGTWVSVGPLRNAVLEAAGSDLLDVVITGQDKRFVGCLAWQTPEASRDPAARERLRRAIAELNLKQGGSSRCVARILLLADPPDLRAGEITEKGYVNQRRVIETRASDLERLYSGSPDGEIILVDE